MKITMYKFIGLLLLLVKHTSAWATFEICESVNTVARGASVIITSPGYLGTSQPGQSGVQMCECILRSQDGADMYMDYLQTQLTNEGDKCPYEFVLVESKRNINQTGIDKEIEVCGKQHVDGRWLQGAVRISYASGGPMKKQGLLARFTVDNLGNKPMVELECGKVNTNGLKLGRPPKETNNNEGSVPLGSGFRMPIMPMMPQYPTPTTAGPKPIWNIKIANEAPAVTDQLPTLKVNLPVETFGKQPMYSNPSDPSLENIVPETKPPAKKPPKNENRKRGGPQGGAGRKPAKKNSAGKVVAEGDPTETVAQNQNSGGMVALVFAGIGAVLILGSVGILFLHNYRKRQRIKRKEETYASGGSGSMTYGKGWEISSDGESIYATVADVDALRDGCVNPAVGVDDECERMGVGQFASKTDSRFIGNNVIGTAADDDANALDPYDKIALKNPTKASNCKNEIAVIDVHQSFDSADEKLDSLHNESCLTSCNYATSGKAANRCDECNITRPPRRKYTTRDYGGYDNNIGVKRQQN